MTKIFVVMAEAKHYEARPFPINWFYTLEAAQEWVDQHGNKASFWFEIEEVESTSDKAC